MEVDSIGHMWIIDTGNTPIVTAVPPGMRRTCPPRIVIIDIDSAEIIKAHTFDPSVADPSSTFLNDIVLDQVRGLAYISVTSGDGGIIVYSKGSNSGRFYSGTSTKAQPFATTITINGMTYNFTAPSDTLALSPDTETLYYGALAGITMFSLPTILLSNFSTSSATLDAAVRAAFNRTSANGALTQCDGMTTSAQGSFFYGSFGNPFENSIVQRLPNGTVVTLYDNPVTMQWVDTLGWANPGTLVFSTNRLQKYFAQPLQLNFSEVNFRVFSLAVPGQTSYLEAQHAPRTSQTPFTSQNPFSTSLPSTSTAVPPPPIPTSPPPPAPSNQNRDASLALSNGAVAGISVSVIVLVLAVGACVFRSRVKVLCSRCFRAPEPKRRTLMTSFLPSVRSGAEGTDSDHLMRA